jgi:hypothetical protein
MKCYIYINSVRDCRMKKLENLIIIESANAVIAVSYLDT